MGSVNRRIAGISNGWDVIREIRLDTAVNSFTLDDLSGAKDVAYRIEGIINVGGTGSPHIRLNGSSAAVYDHLVHRLGSSGITTMETLDDTEFSILDPGVVMPSPSVMLMTMDIAANANSAGLLIRQRASATANNGETYLVTGRYGANEDLSSIEFLVTAPFAANTFYGVGTHLKLMAAR